MDGIVSGATTEARLFSLASVVAPGGIEPPSKV